MATIWLIQPMNIHDGTSAAFEKRKHSDILDTMNRAQRGTYRKDRGSIFSQNGPEHAQAWSIRDLLHYSSIEKYSVQHWTDNGNKAIWLEDFNYCHVIALCTTFSGYCKLDKFTPVSSANLVSLLIRLIITYNKQITTKSISRYKLLIIMCWYDFHVEATKNLLSTIPSVEIHVCISIRRHNKYQASTTS